MQIKSWHLALLGLVLFCAYLALNVIVQSGRCSGSYEFGATDCHNEFEALAIVLSFASIIILAFPIVLLGVRREAKKSAVAKRWIITVVCLDFGSIPFIALISTLNRIEYLHLYDIAEILYGVIAWFLWEIFYSSPLILVGLAIIFLFNRWRHILGAILSILLGIAMAYYFVSIMSYSEKPAAALILMMPLMIAAMSYLFAGIFFFDERSKIMIPKEESKI